MSALAQRIQALEQRWAAIEAGAATLARIRALEQRWSAIETATAALVGGAPAVTAAAAPAVASSSNAIAAPKAVVDCSKIAALQPCAQDTPEVATVRKACITLGLSTAQFQWVEGEYYSKPLQYRRDLLKAHSIHYLCKSIVLENTHCVNNDCSDVNNSRFYLVLFQYTEKFNAEAVMRFIKDMNEGLGKKKFSFRLAPPEVSAELTGFGYNAVAPFGTKTKIPIILSKKITELQPRYFWMGGGHVDCKLRVDTDEFISVLQPLICDFTVSLTEEELKSITD